MASMSSTDFNLRCFDCIPQKSFGTRTEMGTFRPKKSKNFVSPFAAASPLSKRFLRSSSNNLGIIHSKLIKDYGFERRASSNDDDLTSIQSSSLDTGTRGDGYIALFVRMLGLDYDPLDREQAVVALWKYSLGGKSCVDNIMQFRGAVNLIVNLLQSTSDSACEAAAGVLRMISSVNMYRNIVAESGSIEEITALLRRPTLSSNVKEQSIYMLCNLSVDEKLRIKIAKAELLHLLLKFLEDEDINVKEAAGGVLANLALSQEIHEIMVEAGAIPKLAKLLKPDVEGSKVIKKEARSALLEIAKEDYHKILILEEGLILVPLIGAAAYNSFKPALYSWPSLPDGTKIEPNSKGPSKYGASELLLGLSVGENDVNLEEAKKNAILGRTQQQFLARIGAIEIEDTNQSNRKSSSQRFTILPWIDGVARLVLILGLEDDSAIARAADAIADSSINEHMRIAFKEAGAVKQLIRLLHHSDSNVLFAVIRAMERLSISDYVCESLEAKGVLYQLIKIFIEPETSSILTEMILSIMTRILDPGKEMRSKFYNGPVNGSTSGLNTENSRLLVKPAVSDSAYSLQPMNGEDLLDSTFLARLVMILKSSSPNLQKKAASILEFFAADEAHIEKFVSTNLSSALDAVFQHESLNDRESDIDDQRPELLALEIEEAGNAISAASRLFTRLIDFQSFRDNIDTQHFIKLLRKLLKSNIPLKNKDWIAASVMKLTSFFTETDHQDLENPVNREVTIYETIPRLIEQIEMSFSPEVQEDAVIELNRIVSEGLVDSAGAVASAGGIFPLVKLIENGSINERAMEAGLAILYNLSMDSENHAAIISAGAVPILRRIVLSNKSQWMLALHVLRALPT